MSALQQTKHIFHANAFLDHSSSCSHTSVETQRWSQVWVDAKSGWRAVAAVPMSVIRAMLRGHLVHRETFWVPTAPQVRCSSAPPSWIRRRQFVSPLIEGTEARRVPEVRRLLSRSHRLRRCVRLHRSTRRCGTVGVATPFARSCNHAHRRAAVAKHFEVTFAAPDCARP